jgi:hypothetical protein
VYTNLREILARKIEQISEGEYQFRIARTRSM